MLLSRACPINFNLPAFTAKIDIDDILLMKLEIGFRINFGRSYNVICINFVSK